MHTLQSILPHQPKSELNNRIIDAGQRLVAIQLANLLATSGYQTLQHQIKTKKQETEERKKKMFRKQATSFWPISVNTKCRNSQFMYFLITFMQILA